MKAEIIFTGTELLLGQILNTNAQYLQQSLAALGIDLHFQVTVGDNLARLKEAIGQAAARADLVIIGGGLGPTEDDISREALSEAIGVPLEENSEALVIMKRFFEVRSIAMPANNLKQAQAPKGSIILDNPVGTAPGLAIEKNAVLYVLVPGPPNEFKEMVSNRVLPLLREKTGGGAVIKSRVIKLCGIGESKVDEMVEPLLQSSNPTLAPTAKFSEIHLRITSKAPDNVQADLMNDAMESKVRDILGDYIYGCDEVTLPEAVGELLEKNKLTIALAEITSGGYLAHQLTSHPRCSSYFKFAAVSGAAGLEELLGIKIPGAEGIAETAAEAVRKKAGADIGIAVTAGGLTPCNPEGDLTIATALKDKVLTRKVLLPGAGSPEIRERITQLCLVLLWHTLKNRRAGGAVLADDGRQETAKG